MMFHLKQTTFLEKCFYVLWTLYFGFYTIFNSSELGFLVSYGLYWKLLSYATLFGLLSLQCISKNFSKTVFIRYCVMLALAILIELSHISISFLIYILFVCSAVHVNFRQFIIYDLKLKIVLFSIVVSLCLLGVINNYSPIINGTQKHALGFGHPNTLCCFAFTIIMEWMYLRVKRMSFIEWVLVIATAWGINFYGGARSTTYTFALIILIFAVYRIYPEFFKGKFSVFLFTIITPLLAVLSFVTTFFYGKGDPTMKALDEKLSMRLMYSDYFLKKYSLSMFGSEIETVSTRQHERGMGASAILDMAYIRGAIVYGVIFIVLYCVGYSLMMRKLIKVGQTELAIFSLFFVLIGFGEAYPLIVFYNVPLLYLINIKRVKINWEDIPNQFLKKRTRFSRIIWKWKWE